MKYLLPILFLATTLTAYPIRSLRAHIKSGNLDYVERYIQNLSERELSQADFQFLSGYMQTSGKNALQSFSKIELADLSGHLAPVLLFKKGNEHYINNEFDLAIISFRDLARKYENTDYLTPSVSMMINAYLQMGFPDSAQFIRDWANSNVKNQFVKTQVQKNTELEEISYQPKGQYTIQLGAFGKEQNAKQSIKKLNKTGYNPRVDKITINGKTLYAVRYGFFESEIDARKIQNKLKQDYAVKSFLKKLD